jgi:hypothetical protein
MLVYRCQNADQNGDKQRANRSFENVSQPLPKILEYFFNKQK